MITLNHSRLGRLGAIAFTAATLVAVAGVPSAEALANHECSLSVHTFVDGSIGGNRTKLTCKSAKKVKLWMEAVTVANGVKYPVYPTINPKSYEGMNGSITYDLPTFVDGAASLDVESKVCFQWTTSTTKCIIRNDHLALRW